MTNILCEGLKNSGCSLTDVVDSVYKLNHDFYDESYRELIFPYLYEMEDELALANELDRLRFQMADRLAAVYPEADLFKLVNEKELDNPEHEKIRRSIKFYFNVCSVLMHWYDGPNLCLDDQEPSWLMEELLLGKTINVRKKKSPERGRVIEVKDSRGDNFLQVEKNLKKPGTTLIKILWDDNSVKEYNLKDTADIFLVPPQL